MERTTVGLAGAIFLAAIAGGEAQPARPSQSTDAERCRWEWKSGGGLGVWAERCDLRTGLWELALRTALPGFVLTIDGKDEVTVLQVFDKPADAGIAAILPVLRENGYIPDDDECVFEPAAIRPVPRTQQLFQIVPTGGRKAALEATPKDEVPEPPCGEYGWAASGTSYFLTDITRPDKVVYFNIGQDGLMFDDRTVTLE